MTGKKNLRNAIIASGDNNVADFIINHWYKSLKANVRLENTDVVVIDCGIDNDIKQKLVDMGVIVHKVKVDGFVQVMRFKGISEFLKKNKYDQVLATDGGDIIFQADISRIMNQDKDLFRIVIEDSHFPFEKKIIRKGISGIDKNELKNMLKYGMINVGVVFAPADKMIVLCDEIIDKSNNKIFGEDQIVANYFMFKLGYKRIENVYNFIPATSKENFYVRNGVIYTENERIVPIVHNAGFKNVFRIIDHFGYGKDRNRKKQVLYFFQRLYQRLLKIVY